MRETYVQDQQSVMRAEQAGREAARYSAPDPVHWLTRSAEAGVTFGLVSGGGFFSSFLEADMEEASFLDSWLHATPGGAEAVERLLRQRRIQEI
jgi:hypothetical protein